MRILLKKLTEKSLIPSGKNMGLTVGDVIKLRKLDLIYSYFHYSNITFTDDILDKLVIKLEDRISKPGKAPDKFDFYNKRNFYTGVKQKIRFLKDVPDNVSGELLAKFGEKFNKKKQKAKSIAYYKKENIKYSRMSMQRKNHGH